MVGVGVAEHPASLLVPVVLATLASSGFMVVKYVEQVVVQRDRTFTIRHHATKTMAVAAVLLTLQAHGLVQVEADTIQAAMVLLAITLRLVTSFVMKVGRGQLDGNCDGTPGLGPLHQRGGAGLRTPLRHRGGAGGGRGGGGGAGEGGHEEEELNITV